MFVDDHGFQLHPGFLQEKHGQIYGQVHGQLIYRLMSFQPREGRQNKELDLSFFRTICALQDIQRYVLLLFSGHNDLRQEFSRPILYQRYPSFFTPWKSNHKIQIIADITCFRIELIHVLEFVKLFLCFLFYLGRHLCFFYFVE